MFKKLLDSCRLWPTRRICPQQYFPLQRALRHLNKLRCIFRTQSIDFSSKAPDTYLRRLFELRFMPHNACTFIRKPLKSQSFRRPFARPSRKKRKRNNILIALSLSLASFANVSFLGLKSLQLCLLKQGMQRSKEGLCQEIIQNSSADLASSEKKLHHETEESHHHWKTMAMEIFRNFWLHREKSLSRSELIREYSTSFPCQAIIRKF